MKVERLFEPHPFINKFMVKESNNYVLIEQLRNKSFQERVNPYPVSLKPRNTNLSDPDLWMDEFQNVSISLVSAD